MNKSGITDEAIDWRIETRQLTRVMQGVYIEGPARPTTYERALALNVVTGGVAYGSLAGILYKLDSIDLEPPFVSHPTSKRRGVINAPTPNFKIVNGFRCADGPTTVANLAGSLDDDTWEQVLESGLRKKLLTISELVATLQTRRVGNPRIRRVLKRRGLDTPATDSLLETLAIQLIRTDPSLPTPIRQRTIRDEHDRFVARVDLCWPHLGVFLELDGRQHIGQPLYDAQRQTDVVAVTGWTVGRFEWNDIIKHRRSTLNRIRKLLSLNSALGDSRQRNFSV